MSIGYSNWHRCLSNDSAEVISGEGGNIIPQPEERSLWREYLDKFKDPLIVILCIILVLSLFVTSYEIYTSHDWKLLFEPVGIFLAILLSTGIGFWFEVRADREFKVLSKVKNDRQVKVVRRRDCSSEPRLHSIRKSDVVKGDLVKLEAGDEVPADGTVIECDDLRVDESAFTGEPYASKSTEDDSSPAAYASNFLLRGSVVISGSCYYIVSAVGLDTEEGKGAIRLQESEQVQTPLNRQLDQLGTILTRTSYIIAALILVGRMIYYFAVGHQGAGLDMVHFLEFALDSIMIAVTLIVVAVPEGLPMSVNVSLALSMKKMLSQMSLVRKMHACETMGAATVICTDKTGTLTRNMMSVVESFFTADENTVAASIAVNSTAELDDTGDGGIGNPTEVAILRFLRDSYGRDYLKLRSEYGIVSQTAFTSRTKYMSTTARGTDGSVTEYIKGAPEIVMSMCAPCDDTFRDKLASYQSRGMRTLGFAIRHEDDTTATFIGVVGIADPVRDGVKEAILTCTSQAGVRVIMVTGDVAVTAKEIGRQIGLITDESDCIITGNEFASMSDEKAMEIIPELKILSRARPEDKSRLVDLLQRRGEVVAVTGDGTNDALALKKAQVGLSMGDGTAMAKEVSDITIVDNSFASINRAIMWGRSLYLNIRRFIIFQMTINVCACLVVLVGAFTGLDSPLTVTQMLWVNLIMDTFAAMALSSLPADPRVMNDAPRKRDSHIVDRKMLRTILLTGAVFFILMAGLWQLLWHVSLDSMKDILSADTIKAFVGGMLDMDRKSSHLSPYELGLFFSTFVIVQFWNLFNARYYSTGRSLLGDLVSIVRGKRKAGECFSAGFGLIAAVILVGQILIVNVAGDFFDVAPLSLSDWITILLLTTPVLLVPDIVRTIRTARR